MASLPPLSREKVTFRLTCAKSADRVSNYLRCPHCRHRSVVTDTLFRAACLDGEDETLEDGIEWYKLRTNDPRGAVDVCMKADHFSDFQAFLLDNHCCPFVIQWMESPLGLLMTSEPVALCRIRRRVLPQIPHMCRNVEEVKVDDVASDDSDGDDDLHGPRSRIRPRPRTLDPNQVVSNLLDRPLDTPIHEMAADVERAAKRLRHE